MPDQAATPQTSAPKPGARTRVRVLVSDSVELVRQGVRRVLAGQRDITIVDEADSEPRTVDFDLTPPS